MNPFQALAGVYAAAVTPLKPDFTPDLPSVPALLKFLAGRGCHGALILGSTGEGPSFSPAQRIEILRAAAQARQDLPGFRLLAGTGTPSLDETAALNRAAFDLGFDGVVTLPPYFFRKASQDGLFEWYSLLARRSLPGDGAFFGYHHPIATGVPLSLELLARLQEAFPRQFAGLKDSSGDPEQARLLGARFGAELLVFSGSDRLFSLALDEGAAGCITYLANVSSPDLRQAWDAHHAGQVPARQEAQQRLDAARQAADQFLPHASVMKGLLHRLYGFPSWPVCPPLQSLDEAALDQAAAQFLPYRLPQPA
jgi:4-hydroxy-tetrahydrodipicolinate synthase